MKKRIEGQLFDLESSQQGLTAAALYDCVFTGAEHALQGSREINLENCDFSGAYPLWNVQHFKITDSRMTTDAQSPIRYAEQGKILDSDIRGPQALRECTDILLRDCSINSSECGWKSHDIVMEDCSLQGAYLLHESRNVRLSNVEARGDFSFQYADTVQVGNSSIRSNEAFRHSKNITVVDSVIEGSCLGWYSENLTFIGCKIIGGHPMCHCKNLKFIDCVMENAEMAFEGSDVRATITGHVDSVKNPLSGRIVADSIGQLILDEDSACTVSIRE